MARGQLQADDYIEIDQQEMIQRPQDAARRLAGLLHLQPLHEELITRTLKFNRPQQMEPGSATRRLSLMSVDWSDQQREVFLKHCRSEMIAYGYAMDESYVAEQAPA